jgi:hypothetical protein
MSEVIGFPEETDDERLGSHFAALRRRALDHELRTVYTFVIDWQGEPSGYLHLSPVDEGVGRKLLKAVARAGVFD